MGRSQSLSAATHWVSRGITLAVATIALAIAAQPAHAAGRCGDHPWCDSSLSPDQRAGLLLGSLTQDEKISLLAGDDLTGVCNCYTGSHTGTSDGVDRVGLPTTYFTDGPVGVRQGLATAMPTPTALAATFDPAMAARYGGLIGNEAKFKGDDYLYAPTLNIMRTPLNGRTFEAFGEDPYLVGRLAVSWIQAAQSEGVVAVVKHFAANNQEGYAGPLADASAPGEPLGPPPVEGNRFTMNAIVDERTLHEIYLPQFEAAVKEAQAGSFMCSYNKLNGQYACENEHLLNSILKRDWGFKGLILADYGAAHNTIASLNNGLDFDPWPGLAYDPTAVHLALAAGQVDTTTLDEHIRRILRTMFSYGLFDRAAYLNDDSQIDKQSHAQTAQDVEQSAITLLSNKGILPLDASRLKSIAVIGPYADKFVTGGGSGNVKPFTTTTPLQGITERAGPGVEIKYDNGSNADSAAAAAQGSDVALVFVGDYETEGSDRRCMTLECPLINGDQDGLVQRVAAANPNTVVVLETGGPVLTPWRDQVKALVEAWYPGERGGAAIARTLFGDVDPGGRLPMTFPEKESDIPTAGDPEKYPGVGENVTYKEGVFVGYRWYDQNHLTPAFPFGFGLSYTSFAYKGLKVSPTSTGASVGVTVTNTGTRAGVDVPQLYLGMPQPGLTVLQPPKQLKAVQKVSLGAGQSTRITFNLGSRDLSYWDVNSGSWRVAPGCYSAMVGRSSRDIVQRGSFAAAGGTCPRV